MDNESPPSSSTATATSDGTERVALTRREALRALGGAAGVYATGKGLDNVFLGYGLVSGTNLLDQDLPRLVGERLVPSGAVATGGSHRVTANGWTVVVQGPDGRTTLPIGKTTAAAAADVDESLGLDGVLPSLVADVGALRAGEFRFEFSHFWDFFDRVGAGRSRPATVAALRGAAYTPADPDVVRAFTRTDPVDTPGLAGGLVDGFREHTAYDYAQYAGGAVQDNLLFGLVDLRSPFDDPTTFAAMLDGDDSGLFCYDFAYRAVEAFHAVPPDRQTAPVFAGVVTDDRHKHVYTVLGSVLRDDAAGGDEGAATAGDLVVPVTFLDYTHSTLYDDLRLRGVLGEGLTAYDARHRIGEVYWNRYAELG